MPDSRERFLVTGALGCIGAWTVRNLVREKLPVTVFDLASEPRRLRLLLTEEELARVTFIEGDITDLGAFGRALDEQAITHVVHLAGMQIPLCRADPPQGARVNVVGTVNVFEAVKQRKERIGRVTYASSIGVFGPPEEYPEGKLTDESIPHPHTHYGVYKQANEGTARVYWLNDGLPSVGLRPYVVYGVGRDRGLTSTPTTAMLAAGAGLPFHISYGGRTVFQYADDTARAFLQAARSDYRGAGAFNFSGRMPHMQEVVDAIVASEPSAEGRITFEDVQLPFPSEVEGKALEEAIGPIRHRKLEEGVAETIGMFAELARSGRIDPEAYVAER